MAKIPRHIKGIILEYIDALSKNGFPIRKAYLFGSHVTKTAHDWSDIDIAIVSDMFEGVRIRDRSKIRRITLSISNDLSPIPFRPEDFTSEDPLVKEIMETGFHIL